MLRYPQVGPRAIFLAALLGAIALLAGTSIAAIAQDLPWIAVSPDGRHFIDKESGERIVLWGVNYDHDTPGKLLEDYWDQHWETVVEDFRELKALRTNVVRVHLQVARFMESATQTNQDNLQRLKKLVALANDTGVYLDLTGLGCYHKQDVPAWYDALSESDRWDVQARFWQEIAKVCRDQPAVFCYDLMNEPILPGKEKTETEWLTGELGGKYFVQRISLDLAGRSRQQVAKAWVERLTKAIREVDQKHLITVGVIPWAQVFPGAKPLFYSPEVAQHLDFVSVHFYPRKDQVDKSLTALKVYEVGKPIVIEEMFPLHCSMEELGQFIEGSRASVDGWISFYWGTTPEELARKSDLRSHIVAAWLKRFRELSPLPSPSPEKSRAP